MDRRRGGGRCRAWRAGDVNKPVRPEVVRDVLSELASGLQADRAALDRALAVVAEESFFAMVDPVPDDLTDVVGPVLSDRPSLLSARVSFEGGFAGALCCRCRGRWRTSSRQRSAARRRRRSRSPMPAVDDLVGEFANMVCGRWLTDIAPQQLFSLAHPVSGARAVAPRERRRSCRAAQRTAGLDRAEPQRLTMVRRPIKVLIVDDSAIVRKLLGDALKGEPDIEVVGGAADPFSRARHDPAPRAGRHHARHRDAAHGRPQLPAQADGAPADAGDHHQLADAERLGRDHRSAARRRDRRHRQAGRPVLGWRDRRSRLQGSHPRDSRVAPAGLARAAATPAPAPAGRVASTTAPPARHSSPSARRPAARRRSRRC